MFETSKKVALGVTLALPAAGALAPAHAATIAAPAPEPETATTFCAALAQTAQQVRNGEVAQMKCFGTFAEEAAFVGVLVAPDETLESYMRKAKAAADARESVATSTTSDFPPSVLNSSFQYNNGGGGTVFQLWGTTCTNSGFNLAPYNRDNWIGSTYLTGYFGMCSKAKHYDAPNLGQGNAQVIQGTAAPNLTGAMYQATSSILFLE